MIPSMETRKESQNDSQGCHKDSEQGYEDGDSQRNSIGAAKRANKAICKICRLFFWAGASLIFLSRRLEIGLRGLLLRSSQASDEFFFSFDSSIVKEFPEIVHGFNLVSLRQFWDKVLAESRYSVLVMADTPSMMPLMVSVECPFIF